ncbi:MAG: alpha-amylase, partial [Sphingomonas sp.]
MSLTAALLLTVAGSATAPIEQVRARAPEDEVIYFVLPDRFDNGDPANDRGGRTGDRLQTGYDPTSKGFYHGGDLKGLTNRLDYIQALGATAIWLAPIFKNKAVQGAAGHESAGYHGYWITDFTTVDPHFGTEAEFKTLVDAAHARGMKVYLDIIANHTADVIQYRECIGTSCGYRSKAD